MAFAGMLRIESDRRMSGAFVSAPHFDPFKIIFQVNFGYVVSICIILLVKHFETPIERLACCWPWLKAAVEVSPSKGYVAPLVPRSAT